MNLHIKFLIFIAFYSSAIFAMNIKNNIFNNNYQRIVGGSFANTKQFPYQVSLRVMGEHNCGGSILSENFILTAAHCVCFEDGTPIPNFKAFHIEAGTNVLYSKKGVVRGVKNIKVHEKYGNFVNDVAIIELDKPLVFSESIKPIKLNDKPLPIHSEVIISGWGKVGNDEDISQILKYNVLIALTRRESRQIGLDKDEIICLAHTKGNGACQGDSGGPAVYNGKLVGVASFVLNGCGDIFPDVYVDVSNYIDWINLHTRKQKNILV